MGAHTPVAYYAPYHGYQAGLPGATYEVAPVAPVAASAPTHSQFHGQDELGGYNYGYQTAESSKQETRTPDGIVQGTYSYVDANGILQTVNYISDAEGFKVAATNLPQAPLPEAAPVAAPAAYVEPAPVAAAESDDMEVVAAQETPLVGPAPYAVNPVYQYYAPQQGYYQPPVAPVAVQTPVHHNVAYYAPTHAYHQAAVPVAPVAPAVSHSQFHAQNVNGEYNYGYATPTS